MTELTVSQIDQMKRALPGLSENEPMAKHTSFRVGGSARLYFVATTSESMVQAVRAAISLKVPYYLFGGGTNTLVSDDGFEGLVIQAADTSLQIGMDGTVEAGAGAISVLVSRRSVDAGFTGFEWATGLPGTMGGAVYGDAGCYGGEMRDTVMEVVAMRLSDQEVVTYSNTDCQFAYRESRFKHEPHVILKVRMQLKPSPDVDASKARLAEIMQKRKDSQPLGASTAGSTFKNVEISDPKEIARLTEVLGEVRSGYLLKGTISAGWLIECAGLLGETVGDIQVSPKHGNFLINHGKGRAQDIIAMISRIKMKVRDLYGIQLHEEIQLVGF